MKKIKLILFLLLFSRFQTGFSCGYYPYGEDIRICLFSSNLADEEMSVFYYSTYFLSGRIQDGLEGPNANLEEWYTYFNGEFSLETIDQLVYLSEFDFFFPALTKNELFQHFKAGNDRDVADYLQFAKCVEYILEFDFWSDREFDPDNAKEAYSIALRSAEKTQNELLKLRYYYQAIVLAYYINDRENVHALFNDKILPLNSTSVITDWARFYDACAMDDELERYLIFARLFEKTRSKNEYIYKHFPRDKETQEKVLAICKTDEDRANVIALTAFMNPARGLDEIRQITKLNPENSLLDVLLVREINKMEDWYFTNRYTNYGMGMDNGWWNEKSEMFQFIDETNFEKDKSYLKEVIQFCVLEVAKNKEINLPLWQLSLAYMNYMVGDQGATEKYAKLVEVECTDSTMLGQIKSIRLLASLQNQTNWSDDDQDELLIRIQELDVFRTQIYDYDHFKGQIFLAISRQFLENDNPIMAALFEGQVDGGTVEKYTDWNSPTYQTFNLLNEHANSSDMDAFFNLWNSSTKTSLQTYLFRDLEPYKWRLIDLWATTYLREDRLERALEIYETIPDSVWRINNGDLHYYYAELLDINPFETSFVTSVFNSEKDRSVNYTKPEFVRELLRLKKEVKENQKQRSYNYMLLGNAYYNMTINGNAWYMTEYGLSHYSYEGSSGQNKSYYNGELALHYYQLAEQHSKSPEFAAFCYRLQYKCKVLENTYTKHNAGPNEFMKRFKVKYPAYADDLYGCDFFDFYFEKHKKA